MKIIEERATQAFWTQQRFSRANDRVEPFVGGVDYRLHATIIARYTNCDTTLELDSGGWQTVTTKSRMNAIFQSAGVPVRIYQKDFEWYIHNFETGQLEDFVDGICVNIISGEII